MIGEVVSLVLVGALWGCTNPLLREGASNARLQDVKDESKKDSPEKSLLQSILSSLPMLLNFRVWLPYLLNQLGSVLFYYALASSDLSLAVPICNGLALVFSIVTSYLIGERIEQPIKTILGAALVMAGVAICLSARSDDEVKHSDEVKNDD